MSEHTGAQLLSETFPTRLQRGAGLPAVTRLAYLADVEPNGLVKRRLKALKTSISKQWKSSDGGYPLSIETDVFWRRGAPVRK